MRYQVITIEPKGELYGSSFDNPIEALRYFVEHGRMLGFDEVLFHKRNQLTLTIYNKDLTFAVVSKDRRGEEFVEFHAHSSMERAKELFDNEYEKAKKSDSAFSLVKCYIVDMKKGDVRFAFDEVK